MKKILLLTFVMCFLTAGIAYADSKELKTTYSQVTFISFDGWGNTYADGPYSLGMTLDYNDVVYSVNAISAFSSIYLNGSYQLPDILEYYVGNGVYQLYVIYYDYYQNITSIYVIQENAILY